MENRLTELKVKSSIDGSEEPSLLFSPRGGRTPLIVSLHSWSNDRHNGTEAVVRMAAESGRSAVFPEFRGPNLASNPRAGQACGSRHAMQDIVDAVEELIRMGLRIRRRFSLQEEAGGRIWPS